MKILLLGKNGQVGWELQRSLAPLGELLALDSRSTDYCGDLRDLDGLAVTLQRFAPQVIVNAAAYTAVDRAGPRGPAIGQFAGALLHRLCVCR
jgi:dTDP-4-dehydrorhamnose reductase